MSIIPQSRRRTRPDFSIAVVNVVFLLLLFYLVTGSLIKPQEQATDMPMTHDLPPERLPRPLLLVASDGALFLDGVAVSPDALAAITRRAALEAGALNVLADRAMPARDFLDVLAKVDTGGLPLRLVTWRDARADAP